MAITLRQIALEVGCSQMAVSAVLNQRQDIRISHERRMAILEACRRLDYRPNLLARSLCSGHSNVIGMISDTSASEQSTFIRQHIEEETNRLGYRLMTVLVHEAVESVGKACELFDQFQVEAVICLAHGYPKLVATEKELLERRNNLVFLEAPVAGSGPYLSVNPLPAYRDGLRHLLSRGRKRPALLMEDSGYASIQSRLAAWSRLCREFGLEEIVLKTHVFQSDEPEAELMAECQQLLAAEILPRGIDALFCHSDNDALAMLGSCQAQGVACPDRLALIGWDDLPLCQLTFPPLASVNLQPEAFGVNLVHLALRQIGREEGKALPIAIDATFTCRRSAG